MALCKALTYFAIVYLAVIFIVSVWLTKKSYEFNTKEVRNIAYKCSGTSYSHSCLLSHLKDDDAILIATDSPRLSVSTGGLHGAISLLYGSVSEFLAVYQARIHTSGSTGRHFMNISVTILTGEVVVWSEKAQTSKVFSAGDHYVHRIGEKSFVEMSKGTELMLYGRGFLPLTMGYWISDSLFSSFDIATAVLTVTYYIRTVYRCSAMTATISYYYKMLWMLVYEGVLALPDFGRSIFNWFSGCIPYGNENIMDN